MLKDNIDFAKIIRRFWYAWPYFAIYGLFFLVLAWWLNNDFPDYFEAKTSVLISKPQRYDDPNRIILGTQTYEKEGEDFFINQQINLKTYPLVLKTIKKLHFEVTYLKYGLLLSRDVYKSAPFRLVLDSTKMSMKRVETPFSVPFEVTFTNYKTFSLFAEGKYPYPMDDRDFILEGSYAFDQWIDTLGLRFKLILADSTEFKRRTLGVENPFDTKYGFVLNDLEELALGYTDDLEVIPEELDASIMLVSLTAGNREKLLDFLNMLNETFIEQHLETKTAVLRRSLASVNGELEKLRESLNSKEESIKSFKMYYGVSELSRKSEILLERIMAFENDKLDLVSRKEYYGYLHQTLTSNKAVDQVASPKAYGIDDPILTSLTEGLMSDIIERNAFEKQGNKDNPVYKQLLSSIEQSKQSIFQTIEGFEKTNEITLENIEKRLRELEISMQELPEAEKQYVRLEREFLTNSELFNDLNKKKSELDVSIASVSADFSVNEAPYVTSAEPFFPNPILIYPLALILSVFLPCCFLILGRLLNHRILEPEDVTLAVSEEKYIGEIDHSSITNYTLFEKYPGSLIQANLDACFNNIQSRINAPLSRIMITSEQDGEGKRVLSTLMASRLAGLGKKTALVDLNVLFDKEKPLSRGFSSKQVVSHHDSYVLYSLQEHLFYIEPVAEKGFPEHIIERVFADLKHADFTHILFLMPPYSLCPNILRLMGEVNAVWWVCRRNVTDLSSLAETHRVLKQNGVNSLFYCLNDTYQKLNLFGFFGGHYKNKRRNPWAWAKDLFKRV